MDNADLDIERVKKVCETLGEHFDTVQIFATRHESGEKDGTVTVAYGAGNWFARYGQIVTWVVRQDEDSRQTRKDFD